MVNPITVGRNFENDLANLPYSSMDDVLYNFFRAYTTNPAGFTQTKDDVLSALNSGYKWNHYLYDWFNVKKK